LIHRNRLGGAYDWHRLIERRISIVKCLAAAGPAASGETKAAVDSVRARTQKSRFSQQLILLENRIMATYKSRWFNVIAFAAVLASVAGFMAVEARADTILYQDGFEREGGLRGSAPEIRVGQYGASDSATWSGASEWTANGSNAIDDYTNKNHNVYLPFVPEAGYVYTLSADVYMPPVGPYPALGVGFTSENLPYNGFCERGKGIMSELYYESSGRCDVCVGVDQEWWNDNVVVPGADGTAHNFQIALDTTAANWKTTFYLDGDEVYSHTYADGNPWIQYVGFGVGDSSAGSTVDNFSLSVSEIPEPGTLALLACGLIGLLAYAWRKRR